MCRSSSEPGGPRRCHGSSGGGHDDGPQVSPSGAAVAFGPGSTAHDGDVTEVYSGVPDGVRDRITAARAQARAAATAARAGAGAGASPQAEPGTPVRITGPGITIEAETAVFRNALGALTASRGALG
jgi:hypothetical protein